MNPQKGQYVKCILRNNVIIEGNVESWSSGKSVLQSFDESSVSIIQHTSQDVVAFKIILKKPTQIKKELEDKFEQVSKNIGDDELRLKNMAELKILMIEEEKKIISDKIKDHHINNNRKTIYEQPGFFKK